MKHLIILGDGMADHPVAALGGKTLLQHAHTPHLDALAREGRCGILDTVPPGFHPGSEVANTSILGYDVAKVYEGRGPLEAASIGYTLADGDLALRCNIITVDDANIVNHHGGHLRTEEGDLLVKCLNDQLASDRATFVTGTQYRQLLVIHGGDKDIECAHPHDHPGEPWRGLLARPAHEARADVRRAPGMLTPRETCGLINGLIIRSHAALAFHPFNVARAAAGRPVANSIWPWGGGYRPDMTHLCAMYPQVRRGAVISAVDLIRGIGRYAGLDVIRVEGATGMFDTDYAAKVRATIDALSGDYDFVFLHIEASDEAGHDGDLNLKLRTIEDLDSKVVGPLMQALDALPEPVAIALLPDHPTPVEMRIHVTEPVPFAIRHPGVTPDDVATFDETACARGSYGHLPLAGLMQALLQGQ